LGIDLAVNRTPEQLAEAGRLDVRSVQDSFFEILTRASIVIVMREYLDLGHAGSG
jgi:hypothetical protein